MLYEEDTSTTQTKKQQNTIIQYTCVFLAPINRVSVKHQLNHTQIGNQSFSKAQGHGLKGLAGAGKSHLRVKR